MRGVDGTDKLAGRWAVLSSGGVGSNSHAILDRWACFGGLYVRLAKIAVENAGQNLKQKMSAPL
jgi:hypothetical protein